MTGPGILYRYLAANGMARRRFKRGHYSLKNQLWMGLCRRLYAPAGRKTRSSPPGAFRTAWGWRRVSHR